MQRAIDTERLLDIRAGIVELERSLTDHHRAARGILLAHGRRDATQRLTSTESWLSSAAERLDEHVDAVRLTVWLQTPPGEGPSPQPIRAWDAVYAVLGPAIAAHHLASLPKNEQLLIARWRSTTIATLPGAPLFARVRANRRLIELELERMDATASTLEDSLESFPTGSTARRWRAARLDELRKQQEILRRLARRDPIWFEAGEDGRFMEWIGPQDAEHVVFIVPGTGHSLWTADDLGATGARVHNTTTSIEASVAVVVAMGYDAPDNIPAAAFSSYAEQGGPELARVLDSVGIDDQRNVTLVGHSYGSYVATKAVAELNRLEVDQLVLIGSPGVGVDSVADIPFDPSGVWAGLTDNDSITLTSSDRWVTWLERIDLNPFDWTTWDVRKDGTYENLWFGTNPAHPSFGAQRLEMFGADGHSGYFGGSEQNNPALENLARVFVGLDPMLDE